MRDNVVVLDSINSLKLTKMVYRRVIEITCQKLDNDIEKIEKIADSTNYLDNLGIFYSAYLMAFWEKHLNAFFKIGDYINKSDDFDKQKKLILEVLFPDSQESKNILEEDVKRKLDWYKRKISKDFEKEILNIITSNSIESPIEKLFLMEWEFNKISEKYSVYLLPQTKIETDNGIYILDFLVKSIDSDPPIIQIGIELDGHDFHEKTKEQAISDKSRDRAIVRSGITIMRFAGSEIVQNTRKCVMEISTFLDKSLKGDKS